MEVVGLDTLFCLGLSHRTAEVDVRERFAVAAQDRESLRDRLESRLGLAHHVVVSTCNRTELYGCVSGQSPDDDLTGAVREAVFPGLDSDASYRHLGPNTVFHLYRVAAGLDSLITGETEILGQVKSAAEEARGLGATVRLLDELFTGAVKVGKRVRTETKVSEGSLSVASTAVKLARKIVGQLDDKTALVIGAGETGRLTARHLRAANVGKLIFCNRTVARAEEAAQEFGGEAIGLDALFDAMDRADVVIGSIEAPEPVVTHKLVRKLRGRTRCFVDISVPRSMEPSVGGRSDLFAFDIDDLAELVEAKAAEREAQITRIDEILVEEMHKFLSRQTYNWLTPMVTDLKSSFDDVVTKARAEFPTVDEVTLQRLASRLFGVTVQGIKTASRDRFRVADVRRAYQSFLLLEGPTS